MKKLMHHGGIMVLVALAFGLTATAATAQTDDVRNSKHNLSATTRSGSFNPVTSQVFDLGEICVYCHTPHGGSATAPIWNRSDPSTGGYTMYTSTTIDMAMATTPTGVSLACLSCHDGTVGLDVLTNYPRTYNSSNGSIGNFIDNIPNVSGTPADFSDKDLSNDHPISVEYDNSVATGDPSFNAISSSGDWIDVGSDRLPLYDDAGVLRVQCGTCHNPHENRPANYPFLRVANTASAMCLACHIK